MKGLLIRGVNNKEELEMIYLDNKEISAREELKFWPFTKITFVHIVLPRDSSALLR